MKKIFLAVSLTFLLTSLLILGVAAANPDASNNVIQKLDSLITSVGTVDSNVDVIKDNMVKIRKGTQQIEINSETPVYLGGQFATDEIAHTSIILATINYAGESGHVYLDIAYSHEPGTNAYNSRIVQEDDMNDAGTYKTYEFDSNGGWALVATGHIFVSYTFITTY